MADISKREDVNPQEGVRKYGDTRFADPTNHKYPIDTAEHVRAAASYIGMPKNADKYSPSERAEIESRIHAREHELGIGSK